MKRYLILLIIIFTVSGCGNAAINDEKKNNNKTLKELPEATYNVEYVISKYKYKLYDSHNESSKIVTVRSVFGKKSDYHHDWDSYSRELGTLNTTYSCEDDDLDTIDDCMLHLNYMVMSFDCSNMIKEMKKISVNNKDVYYKKDYSDDNSANITAIMPITINSNNKIEQFLQVYISDSENIYQIKDEIVTKVFENVISID